MSRAGWSGAESHGSSSPGVRAAHRGRRGTGRRALPGVRIEVAACDVADPAAVAVSSRAWTSLRGVVHAAGVVDDVALLDLDREALRRAVRAKVLGGGTSHEARAGPRPCS